MAGSRTTTDGCWRRPPGQARDSRSSIRSCSRSRPTRPCGGRTCIQRSRSFIASRGSSEHSSSRASGSCEADPSLRGSSLPMAFTLPLLVVPCWQRNGVPRPANFAGRSLPQAEIVWRGWGQQESSVLHDFQEGGWGPQKPHNCPRSSSGEDDPRAPKSSKNMGVSRLVPPNHRGWIRVGIPSAAMSEQTALVIGLNRRV